MDGRKEWKFIHNFNTRRLNSRDIPKERFMGDGYCEGRHVDCSRCSMFMAKFFRVPIM